MSDNSSNDLTTRNARAFKRAVIIFAIVEALVIAGAIYLSVSRGA